MSRKIYVLVGERGYKLFKELLDKEAKRVELLKTQEKKYKNDD